MSASDVLSTIANSETIHHEESGEMVSFLFLIQSLPVIA
jgi:hypothetical protein